MKGVHMEKRGELFGLGEAAGWLDCTPPSVSEETIYGIFSAYALPADHTGGDTRIWRPCVVGRYPEMAAVIEEFAGLFGQQMIDPRNILEFYLASYSAAELYMTGLYAYTWQRLQPVGDTTPGMLPHIEPGKDEGSRQVEIDESEPLTIG